MFIPCSERKGSAYFEFQYCKKEWNMRPFGVPAHVENVVCFVRQTDD